MVKIILELGHCGEECSNFKSQSAMPQNPFLAREGCPPDRESNPRYLPGYCSVRRSQYQRQAHAFLNSALCFQTNRSCDYIFSSPCVLLQQFFRLVDLRSQIWTSSSIWMIQEHELSVILPYFLSSKHPFATFGQPRFPERGY